MQVPFPVDLTGRVAAVTGGGGILCSCMARAMGACGAAVAVLDLREEAAESVAEDIRKVGGKAMGVGCNVLDRASLDAARERIRAQWGPADILVNGAGGNHPRGTTSRERVDVEDLSAAADTTTFFTLDPKGMEFVFGLNFMGTLLTSQVFARDMVERGAGTVINVSSMSAFRPLTKVAAYSAAKAAVSNFTQWLAVHLAGAGVRVNAIAPGFFVTEQIRALLTEPDGSLTARGRKILDHTPAGRFGEPEDLLGVLLWLLSSSGAGFVTGVVVPVDGGFAAYSGV